MMQIEKEKLLLGFFAVGALVAIAYIIETGVSTVADDTADTASSVVNAPANFVTSIGASFSNAWNSLFNKGS